MCNPKNCTMVPITELLLTIVDNRGKSCPTEEKGFPLIATNCIKHSSIYPTFENIRYVSNNTLKTWFRAVLLPNDILFVNKGTPGRVCLVPNPVTFCAAQDMIGLRADPNKVYYKYLFAVLKSNFIQKKISNFHVGIAIPHFKKSDMDNLLIPIIDMPEQKRIGDLYFKLSEKIESNNKINDELESMAKTIYDYWFLQFEFPNEEGTPYKSSGGKMIWNKELKKEIPEGWKVDSLSSLIKENKKSNIQVKYANSNGKYPFFTSGDTVGRHDNYFVDGFNIFMNTGGLAGVSFYFGKTSYSTDTWCITGIEDYKSYLYVYLKSMGEILNRSFFAGTGLKHLQKPLLLNSKIIIPNNVIAKKYENIVLAIYTKISMNYSKNQELTSLRDFLLPMLMNGQVEFKD